MSDTRFVLYSADPYMPPSNANIIESELTVLGLEYETLFLGADIQSGLAHKSSNSWGGARQKSFGGRHAATDFGGAPSRRPRKRQTSLRGGIDRQHPAAGE